jgi:phosphoesterase RecJ-like protein
MKARTHRIVALLIETGIEHFLIHERVYDNTTELRLRMLGYALLNKLVLLKEFNTAYISMSEEELKRFDNQVGDTEGFVNEALSIKGVRMAAFFSEREGSVRISFRSKLDFSVKDLAAEHFNGGGHKNASGGMSHDTLENTIKKFIEILPQYQAQLTDQSAG